MMNKDNTQDKKIWERIMLIGIAVLLLFSVIYFFVAKDQLSKTTVKESYSKVEAVATVGEMLDGTYIQQTFESKADYLTAITVRFSNYGNVPAGTVIIQLQNADGAYLVQQELEAASLSDNADYTFRFDEPVDIRNCKKLQLNLLTMGGTQMAALTTWVGVQQQGCVLMVNRVPWPNTLYFEPEGYRVVNYTLWHWVLTGALAILLLLFCLYEREMDRKGQRTGFNEIVHIFDKYTFLLRQLVSSDFKNKYRRSYLGILWSLLNPLLMMVIMSIVFSVVFRFSNVPNFQVYLILGQVMFSFYSESTQVSVMTIVGSGQLIKKVYLPKYIFPLSKVVFSLVNLGISFIAVFLVMIFYKVPFTVNILYIPLIIGSFFLFSLGVGLILSAMMVFIRDTQHLYSVLMMALGYLTPIFYTIDVFPKALQTVFKFNPLYHYITAMRTTLLYGQPLSLPESAICIGLGILSLTLGVRYFHRRQKKFILYI